MGFQETREQYMNATIDCSDGTLTEFYKDNVNVFNIWEILKRWNGVPNITLTIERRIELPHTEKR